MARYASSQNLKLKNLSTCFLDEAVKYPEGQQFAPPPPIPTEEELRQQEWGMPPAPTDEEMQHWGLPPVPTEEELREQEWGAPPIPSEEDLKRAYG